MPEFRHALCLSFIALVLSGAAQAMDPPEPAQMEL